MDYPKSEKRYCSWAWRLTEESEIKRDVPRSAPGPAPGQNKRALKHVNGVLLKPRRGAFGKSVRRKLKKVVFFMDRKHFFRRSVCQSGARIGHRQKKRRGQSWKCRVMRFTAGRAKQEGKMNSFTGICAVKSLARRVTTRGGGSAVYAFSNSREQNHHFLD